MIHNSSKIWSSNENNFMDGVTTRLGTVLRISASGRLRIIVLTPCTLMACLPINLIAVWDLPGRVFIDKGLWVSSTWQLLLYCKFMNYISPRSVPDSLAEHWIEWGVKKLLNLGTWAVRRRWHQVLTFVTVWAVALKLSVIYSWLTYSMVKDCNNTHTHI